MKRVVKISVGKPVNMDITYYNLVKYEGEGVETKQYILTREGEWEEFADFQLVDPERHIAVPGYVTQIGPWHHTLFEGEVDVADL